MYRIDNNSAIPTLPAPEPPGTPGFFTGGNIAAGQLATILDAPWANSVQEEIITVIQAAGLTLNKSSHTQLFEALQTLYTGAGQIAAFLPLTGGTLQRQPTGADPLRIRADTGLSARIEYEVIGTRLWSVGPGSGGHFTLYDVTLDAPALVVYGNGGGTHVSRGDLSLSRTDQTGGYIVRPDTAGYKTLAFACAGSTWLDNFIVYSAAANFTGNISTGGNVVTSQAVIADGVSARYALFGPSAVTAGQDLFVGRDLYVDGWIHAKHYVTIAQDCNVAGNVVTPNWVSCGFLNSSGGASIPGNLTVGPVHSTGNVGVDGTVYSALTISAGQNVSTSMDFIAGGTIRIGAADAWKPGGGTWSDSSDERLKENVEPYASGLAEIMGLQPVSYQFNGQGGTWADGKTYYGLIAQEAREVMPELIIDMAGMPQSLDGQLGTNLGPLTLALVNAVQELSAKVQALEARGG